MGPCDSLCYGVSFYRIISPDWTGADCDVVVGKVRDDFKHDGMDGVGEWRLALWWRGIGP